MAGCLFLLFLFLVCLLSACFSLCFCFFFVWCWLAVCLLSVFCLFLLFIFIIIIYIMHMFVRIYLYMYIQVEKCKISYKNHKNWFESAPYGSILAQTDASRIQYGLACLWDASWAPLGPRGAQRAVLGSALGRSTTSCGLALKGLLH